MAQGFSLSQPKVFQCQNCREFINTELTNCPYCGVILNLEAATAAADNQSNVAKACSDANFLKIMARALVLFFVLSFVPFLPLVGYGSLILFLAVPVMLVRWWIKYRKLQTADPDYEKAKRDTIIAAVIWSGVIVLWIAAGVIQGLLLMNR